MNGTISSELARAAFYAADRAVQEGYPEAKALLTALADAHQRKRQRLGMWYEKPLFSDLHQALALALCALDDAFVAMGADEPIKDLMDMFIDNLEQIQAVARQSDAYEVDERSAVAEPGM